MSRDVFFFDLDGTLIDSAVGITRCVAHALEKMDQPVPGDAELRKWIGPALRTSFAPVFGDAQRVEQAVELYRERFDVLGWQEHEIYAGIGEVVQGLRAAGHRLGLWWPRRAAGCRRGCLGSDAGRTGGAAACVIEGVLLDHGSAGRGHDPGRP